MAKIVYGVAGEGFGHSSRSHLIGQHLLDAGHDVLFVASRKSLAYLRRHFGARVREIFGLCLVYQNRDLAPVRTVVNNISRFLRHRSINTELYKNVLGPFEPDLVISDFEPFSAWWAWRHGVPFVSIDHQHLLTRCEIEHEPGNGLSRLNAHVVTRCHYFGAARYLILNFFRAPVTSERAVLAPPVVRPDLRAFEASAGEHLVVYTTDTSWRQRLVGTLRMFPEQDFRIYGFNEESHYGNCTFKKTSNEGFLRDLASCRGLVATAGFSLISECLYFRKKMLLLPIQGQYEQTANAHYAEKLGLGLAREQFNAIALAQYLERVTDPIADHPDILWPDNDAFFRTLERTLAEVCPQYAGRPSPRELPGQEAALG
jgi:uncharacterized protein (TIGR00661 family)